MIGSGGNVICNECPGLDDKGQRTLTLRFPACTVNSLPCITPGGTVTRYTCDDIPDDDRVTEYAPGRLVALFWQVVVVLVVLLVVVVLLEVLLLFLLLVLFTYGAEDRGDAAAAAAAVDVLT